MKFNVHGRFQIEVTRDHESWVVYRVGNGMRIPDRGIVIPAGTEPNEIRVFLDDIFHELAGPNTAVDLIAETDWLMHHFPSAPPSAGLPDRGCPVTLSERSEFM